MNKDLDFSVHFSPAHPVPEPALAEEELQRIDELGSIGEANLKSSGVYVYVLTESRSVAPRNPSDCTVLAVEDDDGTGMIVTAVLEKVGYRTRRARNRSEVVAELSLVPKPDLVLLDVMLPDVNGFDVLNRIRQHAALRHIPVIMLTSLAGREDVAKGLLFGADGYLSKPARPSTLVDAVQAI